jgi:transposase
MSVSNQRCAGIDVSKSTLDIAISNIAQSFTVPNEDGGFNQILKELKRNETQLILMEATGDLSLVWLAIFSLKVLMWLLSIPDRREILPAQWAIWLRPTK